MGFKFLLVCLLGLAWLAVLAASPSAGLAVEPATETADEKASVRNLFKLGWAINQYQAEVRQYPAAYFADKAGKPLLSWRVAILPQLGEKELYGQFKLNEPWDSPHNRLLLEKMPAFFHSATRKTAAGMTCYQSIRHSDAILNHPSIGGVGRDPKDIIDGLTKTICLVETAASNAVPWTKPDDFVPDEMFSTEGLLEPDQTYFRAVMCDSTVRLINGKIPSTHFKALITIKGLEIVGGDILDRHAPASPEMDGILETIRGK